MRAVAATTSDPNKRRASYVDMAKRAQSEIADHTEAMAGKKISQMVTPVTCVPRARCELGHVRLTMVSSGATAPCLAGSTSPDFDCRGFFTRAIAR